MNPILANSEERMKKVLEATRRELAGIRGGKATPALLDTVRVEAYGQAMALNQYITNRTFGAKQQNQRFQQGATESASIP